ncbi:probable plastid-lipid-associated protein 8, chloroplastic [Primulina huaijiensis]|uniref:probable plastid-lipid-associated protein 8, chloroplastic n=1 Tax=Primulina huaijiensis TaxID=1492673 RepID=UPI003CC76B73
MATVVACSFAAANSSVRIPKPFFPEKEFGQALVISRRRVSAISASRICASMSVATPLSTKPDDLVESILSQVMQTDRGVLLSRNEHQRVAEVANELQKLCVAEPTKCPLIFGEWDVLYCSNPTSPGGGYRNAFGRLIFKTKEMIQVIESPDTVKNRVSFSALGLLDGEVSLKGKLTALDGEWVRVVFDQPELKVGGWEFKYGGESEVKLQITYIDDKIRLGKGSRGSLFVFQRREPLP